MADLIFNPLLKKGFQYDNTAAIQAEIDAMQETLNALQTSLNALQNQKITKCFTAADLAKLEDNEIFEWQGASGTVDETAFVNGYFYKKEVTQIVLVSPVSGAYITNADFSYNGFYYANGNVYAKNVSNTIPLNNSYTLIDINTSNNTELITVNLDGADWQQPGTIYSYVDSDRICHKVTLVSCTGAGGAGKFYYDFGNGLVVYGNGYSTISGIVEGKSFVDTNDNRYDLCINPNITSWGVACIQVDSNNNIIDFWPSQAVFRTYYSDVTINSSNYSVTDTQSRLLNIENASNGDINITQNLNVSGDLNVSGTQRIVHSEEIDSENDFINLRYNNPLALANDEQSGIKVENYDGNNNNCIFGVDNAGWARIGDESGTLQKIATIEENPADGLFVQYDETAKELKTAAIPEATTTAAGLMSATDKKVIYQLSSSFSIKGVSVPDYYCHLLSDITDFWNSPSTTVNLPAQGFCGLAIRWRNGGNLNNNTANIVAMVSYQNNSAGDHRILKSSDSEMVPKIIEYQNRYYISLDFGRITAHTLFLFGKFIFCLDNDTFALQSECTVIV